ncbi:MAG: pentapeptide repeat-containing protein [Methanophagales archaeon]|nr:pentapeptide repeat-containing protein [Methanophagales archaeon]
MNIDHLKLEYLEKAKLFEELRDVVIYKIQSEIKSNPHTSIRYFKARIKSFNSFCEKIDEEGITTIPEAFSSINDILGVRLMCLYKTELRELCDWVEKNFEIIDKKTYLWDGIGDMRPSQEELQKTLKTGYTSIHYIVKTKESQKREGMDLKELKFEIQSRTILEEAWGEFTHEVYKDSDAPKYIVTSYQILSKYLNILNEQVEFLKTTYKTLSKNQITSELIENINYENKEHNFLDLSRFTLKNLKHIDCRYFTFKFINSNLYNIEFNRCNMMNFDFTDAELKRVKILNSKGVGRNLINFEFKSSKIDICEFKNLSMMKTDFGNVNCRNTTFEDVDFMNTDFFNANFIKCTFKKINFMNVFNIEDLNFIDCEFDQITVFGENAEGLRTLLGGI